MKCTKCNKEGAYIRIKTKEIVCRQCGHVEPVKKEPEANKN